MLHRFRRIVEIDRPVVAEDAVEDAAVDPKHMIVEPRGARRRPVGIFVEEAEDRRFVMPEARAQLLRAVIGGEGERAPLPVEGDFTGTDARTVGPEPKARGGAAVD